MNRSLIIIAGLALLGIFTLSVLPSCNKPQENGSRSTTNAMTGSTSNTGGMRIAYVDIDTFEAHYESLKKKKEEFQTQQDAMESELQRSAQQMQADYASVVRKQQEGTLTQSEADAAQKRLGQMQQSLETRRAALSSQFTDKLQSFNQALHKDMDAFLADYSKAHHFDYVLSYSHANASILYGDKSYDITQDVIKGMNERAAGPGASKEGVKSK